MFRISCEYYYCVGPVVVFTEKRTYDLTVYTGDITDQEYTIEPGFKASLTDINERIIRDSMQVGL